MFLDVILDTLVVANRTLCARDIILSNILQTSALCSQ